MKTPWYEQLFAESAKAAFGVLGSLFGLLGALAFLALPAHSWECFNGSRVATESSLCSTKVVTVPLVGEAAGMTAVGILGFYRRPRRTPRGAAGLVGGPSSRQRP